MKVRIDDNYTQAELAEITAGLIESSVITSSEMYADDELQKLEINFFNQVELLYPAYERLVKYTRSDRKGWFDQSETANFYVWFTLQLLRGCQLQEYAPSCAFESGALEEEETFVIQAGHITISILSHKLNHPELISHIVGSVNRMLEQVGSKAAFYEIDIDEGSLFLLLSPQQYQKLLEERLMRFSGVEYPEIEAWRATIREEDLPF